MLSELELKNFQSWEHLKFPITKGVTGLTGYNKDDGTDEGSGKSSIPNALAWCLFGQLPKDTKIDDVISYGASSGGVSAKFSNGDQIVRYRKPNELFIQLASGKIVKGKDAKETQDLIEEYIGCNFETFCQSTYFAQNYSQKFLTSNQENKGKILSGIQNLSIFDKARKEVTDLLKIENDKISSMSHKLEIEYNNINHLSQRLQTMHEFIQSKQKQYDQSKNELEQKIEKSKNELKHEIDKKLRLELAWSSRPESSGDDLDLELSNVKSRLGELLTQKSQISTHNKTVNQMSYDGNRYGQIYNKLQIKRASLDNFIKNPSTTCPSCGSELKNLDLTNHIRDLENIDSEMRDIISRVTEIGNFLKDNSLRNLDDLESEEKKHRSRILEIETVQATIKSKQKEIDALNYAIMNSSATIKVIEERLNEQIEFLKTLPPLDISKELNDKTVLTEQLHATAEKYGNLENLLKKAKSYALNLEKLKDGFREIKSYVFNNALNELNYRTNQYLNELFQVEASIKFTTEDQKIETTIMLDGIERSLGLLSGGQHRRFNLAVDLALSDLVESRKTSKLNLLVLDEYFKDLSEASMEKCLDLLKSRKSPVIIIEHNSIFKNIVDNTFHVELENGVSHESRP